MRVQVRSHLRRRLCAIGVLGTLAAGCVAGPPRPAATAHPIVVQGAMDVEVRVLASALQGSAEEKIQGWTFWKGTIDGYPVIVSKTLKGMSNAAAATVLAVEHFAPVAIINQGTAGGHQPDLHVSDIVVGLESVNLGSFKTGFRRLGEGSNIADWKPLDLLRSDGSASQDPNAQKIRRFVADPALVASARKVAAGYTRSRVVEGVIGSADVWNSELDRIQRFHDQFGTTVEEMETASAAQIAGAFHVPFLGVRVVSNNITNGGPYQPGTGEIGQQFALTIVRQYIADLSASARSRPANGQ